MHFLKDEDEVLDYLRREERREASHVERVRLIEEKPLGGLKLDRYRQVRSRLAAAGLIEQREGRWYVKA